MGSPIRLTTRLGMGGSSLKLGWGGSLEPPSRSPQRGSTPPPASSLGPTPFPPSEIRPSAVYPPQDTINLTLPVAFSETFYGSRARWRKHKVPTVAHCGPGLLPGILPAWDTRLRINLYTRGFPGSPTPHPPLDCEPQEGRAWAVSVIAGPPARGEQVLWECVWKEDRKESREKGREGGRGERRKKRGRKISKTLLSISLS